MFIGNAVSYMSITKYNLQRIVEILVIITKRLIAYTRVYILSYEECCESLLVYSIYGGT
jgi:hypothetical protein